MPAEARRSRPRWRRVAGHPLTHLVAALVALALVQSFVAKVYQVPSASMERTLLPGDRILVDRVSFALGDPQPGDVVVFDRPASWRDGAAPDRPLWRTAVGWFGDVFGFGPSNSDALVKRVIALPGQTVACCDDDGRVLVDGGPLDEPYIGSDAVFAAGEVDCQTVPRSLRCFDEVTLGADEYLLLGDDRAASADAISACRAAVGAEPPGCARPVPGDHILGPVFFRFWPLDGWGGVS